MTAVKFKEYSLWCVYDGVASNFNLKQFSRVMEYHPQKGISDEK